MLRAVPGQMLAQKTVDRLDRSTAEAWRNDRASKAGRRAVRMGACILTRVLRREKPESEK